MKNLLGFIISLSFIIILSPISVSSGEMVEIDCFKKDKHKFKFLVDTSGGKQRFPQIGNSNVRFLKDKILIQSEKGPQLVFNIENGKLFNNGEETTRTCKYKNLKALKNKS